MSRQAKHAFQSVLEDLVRRCDPTLEEMHIAFVDEMALLEAQDCISACERCADYALTAFDYILDGVTGSDPTVTEYLMCRPVSCPRCRREITEKTCVAVC